MDYKDAFHKAYLQQQDIQEASEENIRNHGIDPDRLVLLDETDSYWIIKVLDDSGSGEFLDVIWRENFEMITIEIRQAS